MTYDVFSREWVDAWRGEIGASRDYRRAAGAWEWPVLLVARGDTSHGADRYVYRDVLESTAASRDTINGGDGDIIDLSAIDANSNTPQNDVFSLRGENPFTGTAGELRIFSSGPGQMTYEGDVNGDGLADLVILFTAPPGALFTTIF